MIFTESGDFLLERVEHLDAKAPKYLHEAWRKAKQDKIKNFKGLQDMPYEKKIERQKDIAFEFFDEMQKTGRSCPFAIFLRDDVLRLAQEMDEWYHSHLDMFEKKFHEQLYGHYPDGRLKEYKPVESIIPLIYGEIRQYEDGTRYTTKAQRTGCSMCGFGIHLEKRPHRFDRLRQTNPKEWEFLMYRCCVDEQTGERYGWGRVLDYIGVGWEDIPPVQMTIEDYLGGAQ